MQSRPSPNGKMYIIITICILGAAAIVLWFQSKGDTSNKDSGINPTPTPLTQEQKEAIDLSNETQGMTINSLSQDFANIDKDINSLK